MNWNGRIFLNLTAEDCHLTICIYLWLRGQSIKLSFRIRLADKSCSPFSRVFNTADNLKAIGAAQSFLGLNENFTKLKIGDKSLF